MIKSLVVVLTILGSTAFLMGIGFVLINFFTPFSVKKEIEDDQNISLGIIIGSIIIGISVIIAATIMSPSSNMQNDRIVKQEIETK